jgi:flagellar biosynthesis chaperone FliJ
MQWLQQLAQAHMEKLSVEIEAIMAKQPMAYEQLKPVLRKYQVIAPELLNEIQKCA